MTDLAFTYVALDASSQVITSDTALAPDDSFTLQVFAQENVANIEGINSLALDIDFDESLVEAIGYDSSAIDTSTWDIEFTRTDVGDNNGDKFIENLGVNSPTSGTAVLGNGAPVLLASISFKVKANVNGQGSAVFTGMSADALGNPDISNVNSLADGSVVSTANTDFGSIAIIVGENSPPAFTSSASIDADENQLLAGDVDANDPEAPPQTLTYTITGGADLDKFDIVSGTGVLTFKDPPDFENPTAASGGNDYQVRVTVTDSGSPNLSTDQDIVVNVRNVNETPVADDATFSVAENAADATPVGTVNARDPDAGTTLKYAIVSGNTNNAFAINENNGEITVANSSELDFELTPSFTLTVSATDDGAPTNLSDNATITISLMDVNETPSFSNTSPLTLTVAEGVVDIVDIVGIDPDAADTLTITEVSGSDTRNVFSIDETAGAAPLTRTLRFDTAPDFIPDGDNDYPVTLRVTDAGGLMTDLAVTISVAEFGLTPPFSANVPENQTGAIRLPFVIGTGTNPSATLSGVDSALFSVALDTAVDRPNEAFIVTFNDPPDFENPQDAGTPPNNVYDFTATLSATVDGNTVTSDAAISVTVDNVDEAPVFTIPMTSTTSLEDAGPVTVTGFVTGIDTIEPGQTPSFLPDPLQQVGQSTGNLSFTQGPSIDAGGTLTYQAAPDTNGSATFNVTLTDDGSNVTPNSNTSSTVSITINVTAVNDPPVIESVVGNTTGDEDTQLGPITVTLSDVDSDINNVTLGASSDNTGLIRNQDIVISGTGATRTFTITPVLNQSGTATITLIANDGLDDSDPTQVAITINAVNDAPVVSTNQGLTIREGETRVITMGQLTTTDVDATAGQLTYTVTDGDNPDAGTLLLNNVPATYPFTFTQQDIDEGNLSYRHDDTEVTTDSFTFTVDDGGNTGSGGTLTTASATFDIRVLTILAPIANQTFGTGLGPVEIPVAAAIVDGDVPQLSAMIPAGAQSFITFTPSGDGSTGVFRFDPQVGDEGASPYAITLNATTMDGTDTVTFDATVVEGPMATSDATVTFVNVGGPGIASRMISGDTGSGASSVRNTGNVFSTTAAVNVSNPTIPAGTPASIFQTQRWDGAGGPEMQFSFPVEPGEYQVNLYFAELYGPAFRTGARVFDVVAEGATVIDNLDVFTEAGGGNKGLVKTFTVTADSKLDLAFLHQVENPIVNAIQIINLNQVPSQSAPRLSVIGNQTASEGQTLTIDFRAPDGQGDTVVLTASPLPSERFQFTDNGNRTGRLTINAIEGDAGEYPITITATQQNGVALTDAESFVVSVLATNDPPQIATNVALDMMEGASAIIGSALLSGSDPDNSAAELTYSFTAPLHGTLQRDGVNLTSMSFTQAEVNADRIQYVHDGGESIADSFSFTLSDGAGGNVSGTFNINITPVNDAPGIDRSNDLTVRAGGKRPISVAQLSGSDPDDVPVNLTYTATTPVAGRILVAGNPSATFTQQNVLDGMVEYENTNDQATSDSFSVTLVDDDGAMSASATIDVVISNVTILAQIPAQTIAAETGPVDIPVAAASVEGVTPALTVTGLPAFATFTDHGDGTGLFMFDPEASDVGSSTIDLTATAGDVVESISFTLNVVTVPTVQSNETVHFVNVGGPAIPNAMISGDSTSIRNTGSAFSTRAAINLGDASVPNGTPASIFQTLRYDVAGGAEMNYSFPVDPGNYQVKLYFAETYGPAFRTGARVFDVAAEGVVVIDNLDVFSEVGGNAGLVRTISSVTADSTLDITFLHQVENPIISAIEIINLNQVPGQTAPVLERVGNVTVNEGQTVTLRVAAPDAEGDIAVPAFVGLPSFVTASEPDINRVVTFTISPSEGDEGQYPINGTVTQQSGVALTDSESLVLTVVGVNEPPALTVNNPLTVDEGANGSIGSSLLNSADPDDSSSQLSFSFTVTGGPVHGGLFRNGVPLTSGGSFTQADINNNLIEYHHRGGEQSSDSFNFMLADGRENGTPAVPGTFHINITPVNDAPTVDVNAGITLREGTTRTITAAALSGSDVDNISADLVYTVTSPAPASGTLRVDGAVASSFTQQQVNDGKVTYTQDGTFAASDSFGFSFTDGAAPAISGTFDISITADPAFELSVNAGGPAVEGFVPAGGSHNGAGASFGTGASIDVSDPNVAGVPASVFQTVLYDRAGGADLSFDVAVEAGMTVEVTLYFSEIYGPAFRTGARVFDVSIDGMLKLDNFDIFAEAGSGNKAVARSFQITSDGNLDIDLGRVTENPAIAGFRIREIDDAFSDSGSLFD